VALGRWYIELRLRVSDLRPYIFSPIGQCSLIERHQRNIHTGVFCIAELRRQLIVADGNSRWVAYRARSLLLAYDVLLQLYGGSGLSPPRSCALGPWSWPCIASSIPCLANHKGEQRGSLNQSRLKAMADVVMPDISNRSRKKTLTGNSRKQWAFSRICTPSIENGSVVSVLFETSNKFSSH
jgi:hypothetical protein